MEAFTKKLMNPSFVPCRSMNACLYLLRRSITGFMSTSLKVVRMAAVFWTSLRRWAMRRRRRVMGTRRVDRPDGAAVG